MPQPYRFHPPARPVSRVFIHCSDSDRADHDKACVVRDWHLKRGFSTIGYHFYIRKDGTLETGRDLEVVPAAQQGHNANAIAICLGGRNTFTEAQFNTLRDLCGQIHAQLPLVTFHGHREVNALKTCPNFDYRVVLGLDARGRLT